MTRKKSWNLIYQLLCDPDNANKLVTLCQNAIV